jgi:hypothetical protein
VAEAPAILDAYRPRHEVSFGAASFGAVALCGEAPFLDGASGAAPGLDSAICFCASALT